MPLPDMTDKENQMMTAASEAVQYIFNPNSSDKILTVTDSWSQSIDFNPTVEIKYMDGPQ